MKKAAPFEKKARPEIEVLEGCAGSAQPRRVSVAIVLGLVRPLDGNTDVVSLLLGQLVLFFN